MRQSLEGLYVWVCLPSLSSTDAVPHKEECTHSLVRWVGRGVYQPVQRGSAELEIMAGCYWRGRRIVHVHVFVLKGTQLGWEQQPPFLSEDGQVCHFSTDGIVPLLPQIHEGEEKQ